MSKKNIPQKPIIQNKIDKIKSRSIGVTPQKELPNQNFYFGKENIKWMLIGLGLITLGFILMMGDDANTKDGVFNPNYWNEDIFSFRRIRLAPILVIGGFVAEVYAILLQPKNK